MLSRTWKYWLAVGLLVTGCAATSPVSAQGPDSEITRKLKVKVAPIYPELARRMNISGMVKVQITVDKSGNVKNAKLIGGHPVLSSAALDAVRKWRYEPATEENTGIVEFKFDSTQ